MQNIIDILYATAEKYPNKLAFSDGKHAISFSELHMAEMRLSSLLLSKGYKRECVVVLMEKSPWAVCALFGVMGAGCFYVCIDPGFPDARIRAIADKCRARAVICNEKSLCRANLLYGRAEVILFEDALAHTPDQNLLADARARIIDTDPAYIVFTSGSTGEPKGVCASHRALSDYAQALCSTLGFDEHTVFGNQAPLYYDAPLKEILPTVCLGASLIFIPRELFSFPASLCKFIAERGINTLCWAASALSLVSSLGALDVVDMSHLRLVCFGSEVFPYKDYEKWRAACPGARLINLYGPTEATGMSCYYISERKLETSEPIPIGRPFPNTEILLINERGEACGSGEIGEIYIRGSCLAHGYFADSRATAEVFVQNPLNSAYPETVYRTGDLAKYNSHGELVYLGRRDRQIKIMGRRIEPAEIERAACDHAGVTMAALCVEASGLATELFFTGEADEGDLYSFLAGRLPRFMLPRRCRRLSRLPQKENGKLDRASLELIMREGGGGYLYEKA